jgi:hypothetical protein
VPLARLAVPEPRSAAADHGTAAQPRLPHGGGGSGPGHLGHAAYIRYGTPSPRFRWRAACVVSNCTHNASLARSDASIAPSGDRHLRRARHCRRSNPHSARGPSVPTSRGFFPWRLSDAGPGVRGHPRHEPASEALHKSGNCEYSHFASSNS